MNGELMEVLYVVIVIVIIACLVGGGIWYGKRTGGPVPNPRPIFRPDLLAPKSPSDTIDVDRGDTSEGSD